MKMPSPQRGVINPYTTHYHPYPTRYHGAIYTRPVFGTPYSRRPHAVFKPDDFYDYYGVSGLGSLGTLGENSLGLGATGSPIYYLAAKTNTKVSTLQSGLNKVLSSNGFPTIPVTGKLDSLTCAALGLAGARYKEDLLTQVPQEIIAEATRTCNLALRNGTVKNQVRDHMEQLVSERSSPETLDPEPTPASSSGPTPQTPPSEAPTSESAPVIVKPQVEQPPRVVTYPEENIPEMKIPGDAPQTNYAKVGLGLAAVGAVGALAWFVMKRR